MSAVFMYHTNILSCNYTGGEWVECDKLSAGKDVLGKTAWFEEPIFCLDQGTCTVSVSLCLKFEGNVSASNGMLLLYTDR